MKKYDENFCLQVYADFLRHGRKIKRFLQIGQKYTSNDPRVLSDMLDQGAKAAHKKRIPDYVLMKEYTEIQFEGV